MESRDELEIHKNMSTQAINIVGPIFLLKNLKPFEKPLQMH
jgi:hypothetical protein